MFTDVSYALCDVSCVGVVTINGCQLIKVELLAILGIPRIYTRLQLDYYMIPKNNVLSQCDLIDTRRHTTQLYMRLEVISSKWWCCVKFAPSSKNGVQNFPNQFQNLKYWHRGLKSIAQNGVANFARSSLMNESKRSARYIDIICYSFVIYSYHTQIKYVS